MAPLGVSHHNYGHRAFGLHRRTHSSAFSAQDVSSHAGTWLIAPIFHISGAIWKGEAQRLIPYLLRADVFSVYELYECGPSKLFSTMIITSFM